MAIHTAANGWTYTDEQWHKYFNMNEGEVRRIYNAAATKLLTTMNIGISEKMDAQSTCAAIDSIWAEKKRREETKEARENAYEELVNKAYLNLKAAYTPNGQLVASILEDENGKTAEELKRWCEELQSIEDSEYRKMLAELVDDGVLLKDDSRYYVIRTCVHDLSFSIGDQKLKWAWYQINDPNHPTKWGERPRGVSDRYNYIISDVCSCKPFYPELYDFQIKELKDASSSSSFWKDRSYTGSELKDLVSEGVLIEETEGVLAGCYRIPLLGEK